MAPGHEVTRKLRETPAAPVVRPEEIWSGTPKLVIDAERFSIGWQSWPESKGGPGYVVVRRSSMGGLKVVERHPLTDQGWARAWAAFAKLDPMAAAKVLGVLVGRREAETNFAERKQLDARSLAYLPNVLFVGGYLAGDQLTTGQPYELRFLEDELAIYRQGSVAPVTTLPYADVQEVEVAGPGAVKRFSTAQQVMLYEAFGIAGEIFAFGATRIKTLVRIQAAQSELFFLHTELLPEDLRVVLSRGLGAVREAQPPVAGGGAGAGAVAGVAAAVAVGAGAGAPASLTSAVDELTRLGALLRDGLLTREEFDQLKARLIAGA